MIATCPQCHAPRCVCGAWVRPRRAVRAVRELADRIRCGVRFLRALATEMDRATREADERGRP